LNSRDLVAHMKGGDDSRSVLSLQGHLFAPSRLFSVARERTGRGCQFCQRLELRRQGNNCHYRQWVTRQTFAGIHR